MVDEAHRRGIRLVGTRDHRGRGGPPSPRRAWMPVVATVRRPGVTGCRSCARRRSRWSGRFALVPQVVDSGRSARDRGGWDRRRGVGWLRRSRWAPPLGVQVGTAFPRHPPSLQRTTPTATRSGPPRPTRPVLTRAMSGRLARGARKPRHAGDRGERHDRSVPDAELAHTGRFRTAAGQQNLGALQSLWMGQAAPAGAVRQRR